MAERTWGEFQKLSKAEQIAETTAWLESRMRGGILHIDDKSTIEGTDKMGPYDYRVDGEVKFGDWSGGWGA